MARTHLPLFPTHDGSSSRANITCLYKCGDACSQSVPNTSGGTYFGDVVRTALTRRGVLRGGAMAVVAILIKQELLLPIVGGVFVLEAASVIIQVASFKMTGRRVFLMAPIHHHYELKGWAEPQIIVRFWIISIICAVVGLSTLKLR